MSCGCCRAATAAVWQLRAGGVMVVSRTVCCPPLLHVPSSRGRSTAQCRHSLLTGDRYHTACLEIELLYPMNRHLYWESFYSPGLAQQFPQLFLLLFMSLGQRVGICSFKESSFWSWSDFPHLGTQNYIMFLQWSYKASFTPVPLCQQSSDEGNPTTGGCALVELQNNLSMGMPLGSWEATALCVGMGKSYLEFRLKGKCICWATLSNTAAPAVTQLLSLAGFEQLVVI